MRRFILLLLVLWLTAEKAPAGEQARYDSVPVAEISGAWQAVGRINFKGTGFCTGSLISPQVVLTAAHCMYDKRTGKAIPTRDMEFLAGWRNGNASAVRKARRVVLHPDYRYNSNKRLGRVATDIALIELDRPIEQARVVSISRLDHPRVGQMVHVLSYIKGQSEKLAAKDSCRILARDSNVLVLSCQVSYGASGSPVFVMENNVVRVASVVSAKAEWRRKGVALGASLGAPVKELLAILQSGSDEISHIQPVRAD